MQIVVVDDASTDIDVRALVSRLGNGRVEYFRQRHNVGSVSNFNTCLELARGELIHLLHADDRSLPRFYDTLDQLFVRFPQAGACFTRLRYVSEDGSQVGVERAIAESPGILDDWLPRLAITNRMQYVTVAARRAVYEQVGGFFGVSYGEDWEMWVRIASRFPMAYTPEVLGEYRQRQDSISGRKFQTGENIRDLAWVIEVIQNYVPPHQRRSVRREAKRVCAQDGVSLARRFWRRERNRRVALVQLRESLRVSPHPRVLRDSAKLCLEMFGLLK